MPIRAKVKRSTPRRRTVAVAAKPARSQRSDHKVRAAAHHGAAALAKSAATRKIVVPFADPKPTNNGGGAGSYSRALRFLATLADFERLRIVRYNSTNFDLDRMRTLLKKLGNPQDQFRSVHVAGTKGKGSTCAMVASMLEASGYKTGLYTSPHLVDIRERVCVNGDLIPHADFSRLVRMIEPIATKMRPMPTYFDVLTAIAFKYFAEQNVEIAVIETGLGGRLDSTNVIKPEVTAITSISKDHMAQLGNTLGKIATEKAGIFKHHIPALTVMQDPEAETVLKQVAEKVGAPLDIAGKTIEF